MRIKIEPYLRLPSSPAVPPRGILPGFAPKEWVTGEARRTMRIRMESFLRLSPSLPFLRHSRSFVTPVTRERLPALLQSLFPIIVAEIRKPRRLGRNARRVRRLHLSTPSLFLRRHPEESPTASKDPSGRSGRRGLRFTSSFPASPCDRSRAGKRVPASRRRGKCPPRS